MDYSLLTGTKNLNKEKAEQFAPPFLLTDTVLASLFLFFPNQNPVHLDLHILQWLSLRVIQLRSKPVINRAELQAILSLRVIQTGSKPWL